MVGGVEVPDHEAVLGHFFSKLFVSGVLGHLRLEAGSISGGGEVPGNEHDRSQRRACQLQSDSECDDPEVEPLFELSATAVITGCGGSCSITPQCANNRDTDTKVTQVS